MMNGTQTPLSLNEIRFFFTRAAVGAGAPFGIGEELSKASIWLAGLGVDPARPAAAALSRLESEQSSGRFAFSEEDGTVCLRGAEGQAVSAVYAGPALADWLAVAAKDGGHRRVTLKRVDQPVLVAAGVAAAEIEARSISISWPAGAGAGLEFILKDGLVEVFGGNDATYFNAAGAVDMDVVLNGPTAAASRPPSVSAQEIRDRRDRSIEQGVTVADAPWSAVYGFFRRCLVASNDQSRAAGAGAGLTDND